MHIELLTMLALVAGGGTVPVHSEDAAPVSPLVVPVRPTAHTMTTGTKTIPAVLPIVSVPLQLSQDCSAPPVSISQPDCNEEPTLSLSQIRQLSPTLGMRVDVRAEPEHSSEHVLQLELIEDGIGLRAIGLPPTFERSGELYYSASTILDFIARTSDRAVFTATPQLRLNIGKVILDMGMVPEQQLRSLFSGMTHSLTQALLPEAFGTNEVCESDCPSIGVSTQVWSEKSSRVQTNLPEGEVVLLVTPGKEKLPSGGDSFDTAVGIVEKNGWVTFPLEKLPARLVTDPKQVQLAPENQGNGLLLQVTNIPVQNPALGIVSAKSTAP